MNSNAYLHIFMAAMVVLLSGCFSNTNSLKKSLKNQQNESEATPSGDGSKNHDDDGKGPRRDQKGPNDPPIIPPNIPPQIPPAPNAHGFTPDGQDVLGLDTPEAQLEREQKAAALLTRLAHMGYQLHNVIMMEDINDLPSLAQYINQGVNPPHSLQKIYHDLYELTHALARWRQPGHKLTDTNRLEWIDAKVRKPAQFLNYEQLWTAIGADDAFYRTIYDALNHDALFGQAEFPDPADAEFNGNAADKINTKRGYLILALGSIKNKDNNNDLEPGIVSLNLNDFPTKGNSDGWFAEMRYKLYHVAQVVVGLSNDEKATLLSELLNAGKHCSDAKRDSITNALALTNPAAFANLTALEENLAQNLLERMELVAARQKDEMLTSAINVAIRQVTTNNQWQLVYGSDVLSNVLEPDYFINWVKTESQTFRAATYDFHALRLGLKKKGAYDEEMRLNLDQKQFFAVGAYTPAALRNKLRGPYTQNEIMRTFGGTLNSHYLLDAFSDDIIVGAMLEYGFVRWRP